MTRNSQILTGATLGLWLAAGVVHAAPALTLTFGSDATLTAHNSEQLASFRMATGPFEAGKVPIVQSEGAVEQYAWRLTQERPLTLTLMQDLCKQILAAGFTPIFECETQVCGGFDFRFEASILPEPAMHIDLGDFRYLAAQRQSDTGVEYVTLVVSRAPQAGYVQLSKVGGAKLAVTSGKPSEAAIAAPVVPVAEVPVQMTDVAQRLDAGLPVVLEDLDFGSGTGSLTDEDYASLRALADWLRAHPDQSVMLVGHTDGSGGLAGNIALSKQRAGSVRDALIKRLGVAAAQLHSDGIGPLAPRGEDATPEGRARNRRVEVILTPTP